MKRQLLASKLSDFDLFSTRPSLKVKGKDQMASIIGLLLTLITVLCLLGFTVYLLVKMADRDNPNVTVSELVTDWTANHDSVPIAMNSSSFYFGFGLFAGDVISDPEILYISLWGTNLSQPPPGSYSSNFDMEAVLCDWYDTYGDWDTGGYCLGKDFALMSGNKGPDHAEKQSLTIYFNPCSQRIGSPPICKDRGEIDDTLEDSYFRVTYTTSSINPNNYDQPITINYVNYREETLPGYIKTLTFFVTKVKVITDSGWLFESKHEIEAVILEDQRTSIEPRSSGDDTLFEFVITATDKVIVYNRSYTKIPQVFGEIIGLASFLVLIIAIFVKPFFQFKMTETLVNNIYEIKIKEDTVYSSVISATDNTPRRRKDGRENPQRKHSLRTLARTLKKSKRNGDLGKRSKSNETSKHEIDDPQRQEQPETRYSQTVDKEPTANINKPIDKEENHQLVQIEMTPTKMSSDVPVAIPVPMKPRYKIKVSFGEWLLSFFRPQPQVTIVKEAEEALTRNIDIITVAKNTADINKLKACLMDNQQRILFENLPYSFVLVDPEAGLKPIVNNGDEFVLSEVNAEKLREVYTQLRESENKSAFDAKLLSLYDKKCV